MPNALRALLAIAAIVLSSPLAASADDGPSHRFFMARWSSLTWANVALFAGPALIDTFQTSGKYGFLNGPSFPCAAQTPGATGTCTAVEADHLALDSGCVRNPPKKPNFWINLGCTAGLFVVKEYAVDPLLHKSKFDLWATRAATGIYDASYVANNNHLLSAQHDCQVGQFLQFIPNLPNSGKCVTLAFGK